MNMYVYFCIFTVKVWSYKGTTPISDGKPYSTIIVSMLIGIWFYIAKNEVIICYLHSENFSAIGMCVIQYIYYFT